ncbi:cystathionine gamma-lyase [Streptomyces sp. 7-21]|uniref:cystathionine gamma-lyase n=1 Tax=Streptomyces sp. 7-21 TaxID=2802283 RepID=UPI00191F8296|nr:cystathionine gamma-lyase [Streptomyces sp. 7-21]MBL1066157.1 cystathionine gamma-lyase [Streptomyces sp. 7-21]
MSTTREPAGGAPHPAPGAELGDGTRTVHAGLPAATPYAPPMPGPVFAAHYHLPGEVAGAPYAYGRESNPTWTALEEAIAALESPGAAAEAVVFPSGLAATTALLFGLARPGDAVVLPADGYQGLAMVRERLAAFGVEVRTAPTAGDAQLAALDDRVRVLWLETPSNPGLDVCDIRRLAAAARARGAVTVVDNTLATPLGQRPLELGADVAMASGTKAFSGHGDVLLGYAATREAALATRLREWRTATGAILGPMEAWLAHRGVATLQLRTQRQEAGARAVAEALRERPEVTGLRYPGLPDDPSHALAARQMRGFGCVVSFTLPSREAAERFLAGLRIIGQATSFGGVRATAERRGRWGGDPVPEGFIRLSAGIEDPGDLVADVLQSLARL